MQNYKFKSNSEYKIKFEKKIGLWRGLNHLPSALNNININNIWQIVLNFGR